MMAHRNRRTNRSPAAARRPFPTQRWFVLLCAKGLVCAVALGCGEDPRNTEADKNQQATLGYALTGVLAPACPTSPPTVTYTQLGPAGLTSRCATHHVGASPTAGLDVTSYSQMRARVVPNNLGGSSLYIKVTVGSMAANSDAALNEALRNWICSGAGP